MEGVISLVGDSHISFFPDGGYPDWCVATGAKTLHVADCPGGYRTYHLGPLLAHSFRPDREEFVWVNGLLPPLAKVLVVLGEIDCRRHLWEQFRVQRLSVATVAEDLVRRFVNSLVTLRGPSRRVAVWLPHVSPCEGGNETKTWLDRLYAIRLYVEALRRHAEHWGIRVFGLSEDFYQQPYDELIRCFEADLCHLSQRAKCFVPESFLEWRTS